MRPFMGGSTSVRAFVPSVDVRFDDESLRFVLDVPGVRLGDLAITVESGVLVVSGSRAYEPGDEREQVLLGRAYGPFRSVFKLPDWVDPDTISASLTDGVLTVAIEKRSRRRKIKVLSGPRPVPQLGPKSDTGEDDK